MTLAINLTGKRFGLLTAIRRVEDKVSGDERLHVTWLCRCDCGREKEFKSRSLRAKEAKTCGDKSCKDKLRF